MARLCELMEDPSACEEMPVFLVAKTIVMEKEIKAKNSLDAKRFWTDTGARTKKEYIEAERVE